MNKHSALKTSLSLLTALILTSGLSCAVAPTTGGDTSAATPSHASGSSSATALSSAFAHFEKRDFAQAAAAFEGLTDQDANTARLAFIGKALVHLSTDPEWRNMQEAARLLQSAENVEGAPSADTGMLMHALSSLIGVEANISELNDKLANSAAEVARLKQANEALIGEQAALNEALEKLKALAIGD